MLSFSHNSPAYFSETRSIESYARTALAFGELSTAAEAEINRLVTLRQLTPRESTLLAVLRDAIQDGCVRRVETCRRTVN